MEDGKKKRSGDHWLAGHLREEGASLLVGAGALVLASYVNFRTGPALKAAIESPGDFRRQQASRSLLLFASGAVAGCLRTVIFDGTTERLRAALAAEVFAARLAAEPSAILAEAAAGSDGGATLAAEAVVAGADDSDVGLCADLVPKLQNVIRYSSSVLGGTFAMFRASWRLSAAIWPLVVVGAMRGVRAGNKRAGKSATKLAEARAEAMGFAEERLQHRDLVRWFICAKPEADAYRQRCDAVAALASKAARGRGVAHLTMDLASKGMLLGLCQFGSWLVQKGELTAGELTSFFFHATFMGLGLYGLVQLAPELAVGRAAATRLAGVVGESASPAAAAVADGEAAASLEEAPQPLAIAFEGVHFSRGGAGREVLAGFTLEVPAGSTCALVGPSGSGKSTALSLLLRDCAPQRGRVLVGGRDAQAMDVQALRRCMSVSPQGSALLGPSVQEAVAFGLAADVPVARKRLEVEKAIRTACAHDFVMARPGDYAAAVGRGGSLFSGGERQRLALARALARPAPVLILDEPTAALDTATAKALSEAVLAPRPSRPTTLVVTHSLELVKRCDKVAVLSKDGAIVQHGTYAQLAAKTNGAFAEIIRAGELADAVPAAAS